MLCSVLRNLTLCLAFVIALLSTQCFCIDEEGRDTKLLHACRGGRTRPRRHPKVGAASYSRPPLPDGDQHAVTDRASAYLSSAELLGTATSGMSVGALYFAYHSDPVRALKYVAAVSRSAASLKRHDPGIPVAVLTNAINPSSQDFAAIDIFLPIQDEDILEGSASKKGRQWWTRTLYLNATPFDVTIQIDSDRTICSSIASVFRFITGYDMLHVSVGTLPSFDNGVMIYRKGARFQVLLDIWLQVLERNGKVGDDQAPLADAIMEANKQIDFRSGVLPPTFQAKHAPAVGEGWRTPTAMHTLVLKGDVKIVAGDQSLCDLLAQDAPQMRIAVYNSSAPPGQRHKVALSQEECNAMLHGRCRTKEMHWNAAFEQVLEVTDYKTKSRA